jgi:hypothetical protein
MYTGQCKNSASKKQPLYSMGAPYMNYYVLCCPPVVAVSVVAAVVAVSVSVSVYAAVSVVVAAVVAVAFSHPKGCSSINK